MACKKILTLLTCGYDKYITNCSELENFLALLSIFFWQFHVIEIYWAHVMCPCETIAFSSRSMPHQKGKLKHTH